ncbi:hypothetical protein [Pseudanabaena sp. 'Roaring Creek']|uniref:hypothetical protein n=1 Tax=Pseudanabaena sp. 'Roaring Creek' TaxID=1681830 RepID=UPI0006D85355|nr:hypothetical protein [Pseudanabaena sp. 'Roaring Creek']
MFGHSRTREARYQEGLRDRNAGILPRRNDPNYLEAYLNDRPGGLDAVMQYFPTVQEYLHWKLNLNHSSM